MIRPTNLIIHSKLVSALVLSLVPCSVAIAQAVSSPPFPTPIVESINRDAQDFTQKIIQRIYALSRDGIVTQDLINQQNLVELAELRSAYLASFIKFDVDADYDIDTDDFTVLSVILASRQLGLLRMRILKSDSDEDGSISLQEMAFVANQEAEARLLERQSRSASFDLMLFDENLDGYVTVTEVLSLISSAKVQSDTPAVSPLAVPRELPQSNPQPSCDIPTASAESEVFVLTGYQGAALPTISVAGQDNETTLTYLNIEEGETPIYLIVGAFTPTIWKVEGDVERLEQIVIQPPLGNLFIGSGTGVIGVPEAQVTFSDPLGCIGSYNIMRDAGKWAQKKARLASIIEHNIDASIEIHSLGIILIPSGQSIDLQRIRARTTMQLEQENIFPQALRFPTPKVRKSMLRFYPGGLVNVEQNSILSNGVLTPYSVFPSAAGLSQLMDEGKIRLEGNQYFIQEAIPRLPANMGGSHSVQFILGEGVPVPEGPIGHSSMIRDETGECLLGYRCQ